LEGVGTMTMATLTLMTLLMLIVTAHGESILRTNYGFAMETLDTQVYFATDDGRVVLYYTLLRMKTIAEKTPQQERDEQEVFRNPCALDSPETHLDSAFRPRCRYILDLMEKIFALRNQALNLAHVRQTEINALIDDITAPPRRKRGLGSFLGSGLAWTFDLATGPDVEQSKSLLRQVLTTTNKALTAWTTSQNLITRVTKWSSNRHGNFVDFDSHFAFYWLNGQII